MLKWSSGTCCPWSCIKHLLARFLGVTHSRNNISLRRISIILRFLVRLADFVFISGKRYLYSGEWGNNCSHGVGIWAGEGQFLPSLYVRKGLGSQGIKVFLGHYLVADCVFQKRVQTTASVPIQPDKPFSDRWIMRMSCNCSSIIATVSGLWSILIGHWFYFKAQNVDVSTISQSDQKNTYAFVEKW